MKITLLRCFVLLICFQGLTAQTKITGTVKDTSGNPIPGVGVLEKGTNNEVATDLDGNYSVEVKEGAVLEFYSTGFETMDIPTAGKTTISVVLNQEVTKIDKVVITALGIKRKEKALSYNLQEIKQEELTRVKDANFVNSLSGKVAGVNIRRSSSGIGGATRVVLRGDKSILGNNNVLYVVDGVPLYNVSRGAASDSGGFQDPGGTEGIADFNSEDIESISVLTGPSAAALYGYQGSNGVILINTKKGKEGVSVTLSSSTQFLRPFITPDFQNTYGNRAGEYASWGNKLSTPSTYDPLDFFKTGVNLINAATVQIGNKKNQTFISLGSTNSQGILPNNEYNRYNFTLRNTASFLNDKMHLDLSASYIKQDEQNMITQGLYFNPIPSLYLFSPGENFELVKFYERYDPTRRIYTQYWPYGGGDEVNQNPYWIAHRMVFPTKRDRYMFSTRLDYDIFSWLNASARVRIDNTHESREKKYYASTKAPHARGKGYYGFEEGNQKQTYADLLFNVKKRFGVFNLNANFGGSFSNFNPSLSRGLEGHLLTVPNFFDYSNIDTKDDRNISEARAGDRSRTYSIFGLAEVSYKDFLYLTLTGRNDWDSHLVNSKEPSYFYPSAGLSGIISKMAKLPDFISFLKVRASYTETGSPISIVGATPGTLTLPIKGGVLSERGDYPFPDFKAERTRSYEAGLNMRFFHNHFNLDATVYQAKTYNQTFYYENPSPLYKGMYLQAGEIRNRGIELTFGYDTRPKNGKFGYDTNVAYTLNENKIIELVHDYPNPIVPGEVIDIKEFPVKGGFGNRYNLLREGGDIGDVYANQFLKQDSSGNVYVSPDGDLLQDETNPVVKIGNTNPNFTLGWRHHISYKGLDLNLLFNGRFGGIVNSSTQAYLDAYGVSKESAQARDRGGVDLNGGKYDAEKYYQLVGNGDGMQAYYTYDATNIRLQEISLSYTLHPEFLKNKGFKSLTVSLIGNNVWMIYNKAPFDPELTSNTGTYIQGYDYFMPPSVQSFGMGIKLKF